MIGVSVGGGVVAREGIRGGVVQLFMADVRGNEYGCEVY